MRCEVQKSEKLRLKAEKKTEGNRPGILDGQTQLTSILFGQDYGVHSAV
jgi:hypothetical protein